MSLTQSRTLVYHIVDVFTERQFRGNPLAVVLGADDLLTRQLQALAAEFNLSETAFPVAPSPAERDQGVDYRLRIFTPEVEIPFAGHPSIGTAWLLSALGTISGPVAHQLCGAGVLPLAFDEGVVTLTGGTPELGSSVDPGAGLAAVGLSAADLVGLPTQIASAGLPYLILMVNQAALGRCVPDSGLLRAHFAYPQPASGLYVVAWDEDTHTASTRMFAGDIGKDEDAATGSAALALGVYLGANRLIEGPRARIAVTQGEEMGRHSRLDVTCELADGLVRSVTVGGGAVHVAEGLIAVPD